MLQNLSSSIGFQSTGDFICTLEAVWIQNRNSLVFLKSQWIEWGIEMWLCFGKKATTEETVLVEAMY